jgi:hypothetical protein
MMRDDAAAIWTAGIRAVQPERLVASRLSLDADGGRVLCNGRPLEPPLALADVDRIVVVGGGKAAAGLAAGIERLLGAAVLERHRVSGLVSVPEGCGRTLARIEVRETRPAAANLPTPDVVRATLEMLDRVRSLGPRDLVLAVVTGGGSALLAAPREGVTLDDKIALTRRLSAAGADIATLNAARREMSLVKGGGLARACAAGRLVVVAISDVVGDDLDVIASGPCMPPAPHAGDGGWTTPSGCLVSHLLLGTNATAMQAAAAEAARLGYAVEVRRAVAGPATADATAVGARLGREAVAIAAQVVRLRGSERTIRASRADSSGAIARTTRVLATVVRVSAIMKQVNMTAQQAPESHNTPPPRKNGRHHPRGSRA